MFQKCLGYAIKGNLFQWEAQSLKPDLKIMSKTKKTRATKKQTLKKIKNKNEKSVYEQNNDPKKFIFEINSVCFNSSSYEVEV